MCIRDSASRLPKAGVETGQLPEWNRARATKVTTRVFGYDYEGDDSRVQGRLQRGRLACSG
eukprot:4312278-Pleurochrysis_carterae.AAC.1